MDEKKLIGKTINEVIQLKADGYDDHGYLLIKFTDKTQVYISATYGGYTGLSLDEYPTGLVIDEEAPEEKLIPWVK